MNQYIIREAVADDLHTYVDLLLTAYGQTYAAIIAPDFQAKQAENREEYENSFLEKLNEDQTRVILAFEREADGQAGKAVGLGVVTEGPASWEPYVLEEKDFSQGLVLDKLYLLDTAQGTGLASQMLNELLPAGSPASLWIIEGNARADAFYKKHGFEADGFSFFNSGGSWGPSTTARLKR